MKVVDTHTHFKDKFLKVMTDKELDLYFRSGVEYIIGVIDFFPVQWDEVIQEISLIIHSVLLNEHKVDLSLPTIKNILKEEIDYAAGQIRMERLVNKLRRKIASHAKVDIKTLASDVKEICDTILPPDSVDRFLMNIKEEIIATIQMRGLYKIKAFMSLGIHPLAIGQIGSFENCCKVIDEMERLITQCEHVIAIGECGLDHNTELEQKVFRKMVQLAKKLNVPFIMHTPMTGGTIPSKRKCDGIREMGRIILEEKVDPKLCVFDHITDHECLKIISEAFGSRKPYVSCSIQAHWLEPEQMAVLMEGIDKNWHDYIMSNCDFGTYQTPEAFSSLRKLLQEKKISSQIQENLFFNNPAKAFELLAKEKTLSIKQGIDKLTADLANIKDPLALLFSLSRIRKWVPASQKGLELIVSPKHKALVQSYVDGLHLNKIKIVNKPVKNKTKFTTHADIFPEDKSIALSGQF